ncbi:MAG: S8 family serine peptidase [Candidatus Obscuribacterales bacterium]|nr:S8 family serine peptidase [Candidatus Obscuribacterales bacterium]
MFQVSKANKVALCSLTAVLALTAVTSFAPVSAAEPQLNLPKALPAPRATRPADCVADQLLVMASGTADQDDFSESMQKVHGTVIETIGEAGSLVYVVQTEKGKMVETERQLAKDENIAVVQRNWKMKVDVVAPPAVNDPFFPAQWHIPGVNAAAAWKVPNGNGNRAIIGVMDTGVNYRARDMQGKAYVGYDAVANKMGQSASTDHGSLVSSTAASQTNNKINGAAVAPGAMIYPIKISNAKGEISEAAIIRGIDFAGKKGIRILNLSANAAPPHSLSNRQDHPAFHNIADWYHNKKNGLLIVSSGNDGMQDSSPLSPNIMVVSGLNPLFSLASYSNYGSNVWLTAPASNIYCTNAAGRVTVVSGTSFAAPCVAAVAAMVLGRKPTLKNTDIERILVQTRYKAGGQEYTPYYGFGLPNAHAAVLKAI